MEIYIFPDLLDPSSSCPRKIVGEEEGKRGKDLAKAGKLGGGGKLWGRKEYRG